jgi:hypothetical protein
VNTAEQSCEGPVHDCLKIAKATARKTIDVSDQLDLVRHGRQKGSPAVIHRTRTSEMKVFSQSAQSRIPWSSETQCPIRIIPFSSPAVLASAVYSTPSLALHARDHHIDFWQHSGRMKRRCSLEQGGAAYAGFGIPDDSHGVKLELLLHVFSQVAQTNGRQDINA